METIKQFLDASAPGITLSVTLLSASALGISGIFVCRRWSNLTRIWLLLMVVVMLGGLLIAVRENVDRHSGQSIDYTFEERFNENGAELAYPAVLDLATPVGNYVRSINGKNEVGLPRERIELIRSLPLLFEAQVDERPHIFERCLFWSEVISDGKREWWLTVFSRWPYGLLSWHQEWRMDPPRPNDPSINFASFDSAPSNEELIQFLRAANLTLVPDEGFRFILGKVFSRNWTAVTGEDPDLKYELK